MIASTSTGADATPDIGAEFDIGEPAVPAGRAVPGEAASAWPVILDHSFPKMLMNAPLSKEKKKCPVIAKMVIGSTLGKSPDEPKST